MTPRRLGDGVWGRRAARLPGRGVLLVATDLQGNLRDYRAMQRLLEAELEAGQEAILAFTGDLVHGPTPGLETPENWPSHLGTPYADESAALILDFERYTRARPAFSLIGNHEHAHAGGPKVSKFHDDEAAALDAVLGPSEALRMREFIASFPLLAVSPAGVVLTHGAPARTEPDLEAFERLGYEGYEGRSINGMSRVDTVGALLWARGADEPDAARFLAAATLDASPSAFVAYGHDVVREGYDRIGDGQICFSTSFGLDDARKVYLRLDLSRRYRSARELIEGQEIRPLYP